MELASEHEAGLKTSRLLHVRPVARGGAKGAYAPPPLIPSPFTTC